MESRNNASEVEEVLLKNIKQEIVAKGKSSADLTPHAGSGRPDLKMQIAAATICGIIRVSFGAVLGFTGTTIAALTDEKSNDIVLTMYQASWFSSGASLGAIIGGLLTGSLMSLLGQRVCILVVLPFGVISSIILGVANHFWILLLCRIVQGGVVIITSSCALTYLVEICHKSIRGRLIGSNDVLRQIGFLLVFVMGSTTLSWRTVAIASGVITMSIPFIGFIFLPNSPRWLASKGRSKEAAKALTFFMGENYDCESEMKEITKQITQLETGGKTNLKMFLNRTIFCRMLLLLTFMICIIYSGNFVLLTYSVLIFESANVAISPYMCTILVGIIRVVGTIIYTILVDKIGRKPLLTVSSFMAGICMATFGLYFYLTTIWDDVSTITWLPLVSTLLFYVFLSITSGVIILFISELIPTPVRPIGIGFLYTAFSTASFILTLTYVGMIETIGSHWTFWIFALNCFVITALAAMFAPETRNKSLEKTACVNE